MFSLISLIGGKPLKPLCVIHLGNPLWGFYTEDEATACEISIKLRKNMDILKVGQPSKGWGISEVYRDTEKQQDGILWILGNTTVVFDVLPSLKTRDS